MNPLLEMLAEDKAIIAYRPRLNKITGSVTATILLQQILYWYKKQGAKHFYKFKEACSHKLYVSGDSWCEELGFSRREFDTALSYIAIKRNKSNRDDDRKAYVYYWITPERVTYYTIDEDYLIQAILPLYSVKADSADTKSAEKPLPKDDTANTKSADKGIDNTKITSETTPEIYLILMGSNDDSDFRKAFNEFLIDDSNQYRDDTFFWINHNAQKYGASLKEVTHALKTCADKSKEGEMAYFTGILRKKAEAKSQGVKGFGKNLQFAIYEYLKYKLGRQMQYIKNYDLDMENKILYFSVYDKEDKEAVSDLCKIACAEIAAEFDVKLEPKLRL